VAISDLKPVRDLQLGVVSDTVLTPGKLRQEEHLRSSVHRIEASLDNIGRPCFKIYK
jgi:hypothetical protein